MVTAERLAATVSVLAAGRLEMEGFVAYRTGPVAHLQPYDILPCWAGVKSTAVDAALFGWMFVNGGRIAGNSVLERPTVREMLRMQVSTDGKPLGLGLAWQLGRQGRESFVEQAGGKHPLRSGMLLENMD